MKATKIRKLLSFALALLMFICSFSVSGLAADEGVVNNDAEVAERMHILAKEALQELEENSMARIASLTRATVSLSPGDIELVSTGTIAAGKTLKLSVSSNSKGCVLVIQLYKGEGMDTVYPNNIQMVTGSQSWTISKEDVYYIGIYNNGEQSTSVTYSYTIS